jgi:DNA-binding GntR family transcriptional regulator
MNKKIYKEIKERILFMEYGPGKVLNEKEIAKEFNISRTPVREAILKLEWEKLIEIIPRGGVFVSKIEFQALRDIFHVRVYIEGLLARLAANNVAETYLDEIRNLRNEAISRKNEIKPKQLIKIDMRLRGIIHRMSNSKDLNELSELLYSRTLRIWYSIFNKTVFQKEVEIEIREIDGMLNVLTKKDPGMAEEYSKKIMFEHIERIKMLFDLK